MAAGVLTGGAAAASFTGGDRIARAGEALSRDGAARMVVNALSIPAVSYRDRERGDRVERYELAGPLLEHLFRMEFRDGKPVPIPENPKDERASAGRRNGGCATAVAAGQADAPPEP